MVENMSDVQRVLLPLFVRYGITRAVLFGSMAKGTATADSDVDLLVDSHLHGWDFYGFAEDVREAVQRSVDVIDVAHVEKDSPIDQEIRRTGVMIYEK